MIKSNYEVNAIMHSSSIIPNPTASSSDNANGTQISGKWINTVAMSPQLMKDLRFLLLKRLNGR